MPTARYKDLLQVGDEPLYCEADPSEVLWEGSDDEQYPSQAHRKWAYEKAAVRFLEGAPLRLFSSTLQGPFNQGSGWVSPWRSKKGSSASQSRTTSGIRTPGLLHNAGASQPSAKRPAFASPFIDDSFAENHETKTRPDSACHLPSPESLDRPADVPSHHQYLDEDELAMVETWRSTVEIEQPKKEKIRAPAKKSTKTSRKRPAETSSWLKRPRGKRLRGEESADDEDIASMLVQNHTSSPSTRKLVSSQLWDDSSGEDELNVGMETSFRSPEPSHSQSSDRKIPTRCGPLGSPHGILKGEDLSDDELSWPSGSAEKPRTWRAASARSQISHRQRTSSVPKSSPSRRFLRNANHSSPTKHRPKKARARLQEDNSELETQQDHGFVSRARRKKNRTVSPGREVASSLPQPPLSPRLPIKRETLADARIDNATTGDITSSVDIEAIEDEISDFTSLGTRNEEAVEDSSIARHNTSNLQRVHSDLPAETSCETTNNWSTAGEATVSSYDKQEQTAENTFATSSPPRPSIQRGSSDQVKLQPPASLSNTTSSNDPAIDDGAEEENLGPSQLDSQPIKAIDVVPCSQTAFNPSTLAECMNADIVDGGGGTDKPPCPLPFDETAKPVDDNKQSPDCPLEKSPLREEILQPPPDLTTNKLPEARLSSGMAIVEDEPNHENPASGRVEEIKKTPDVVATDETEDAAPSPAGLAPVTEEGTVEEVVTNQAETATSCSPDVPLETKEKAPNVVTMDETNTSTSLLPDVTRVTEERTAEAIMTDETETSTSCTAPILSDAQVGQNHRETTPLQHAAAEVTPLGSQVEPPEDLSVAIPVSQQSPWRDTQVVHHDVMPHVQASHGGMEYENGPAATDAPGDDSMVALSQQTPWKESQGPAVLAPSNKLSDMLRIDTPIHHGRDLMDVDEGQGTRSILPEIQAPGLLGNHDSVVAPSQQTPWQDEPSQLNLRQEIDFLSSQESLVDGATQQESQSPWSGSFGSMRLVAHHALRMAGIGVNSPFNSPSRRTTAEDTQAETPTASTRENDHEHHMAGKSAAAGLRPDQVPGTQHTPTHAPARDRATPTITLKAFRDFLSPSPGPSRHPTGESRTTLIHPGKKRGILTDFSSSPRYSERPRKRVSWGPLPCETDEDKDDSPTQPITPMPCRSRTASPPPDQALADLPDNRVGAFHGHFNAVKLQVKGHRHRILPSSRGPESPAPTAMADAFLAVDEMSKRIHADKEARRLEDGEPVNSATVSTNAEKKVGNGVEEWAESGGEMEEPDAVDAVLRDLDEYIELITVEADVARAKSERTTGSTRRKDKSFSLV
ncbi:hypothetical protein ACRALDRAFT_1082391 [Sodiomyces alcalophilus JCM 7366]|uniref:uncharacterized protein n=1 Tax=Sodiomyces alcalophilus JCM 7366 TaxID=591952 RepID=UPI0039B49314